MIAQIRFLIMFKLKTTIRNFLRRFIFLLNNCAYIKRLLHYILNDSLYKSVLILGSGTAMAQLISIISMPIVTRLYTPSDLGVLAIYSSILAITGISATLRYEFAFVMPKNEEEVANLFGLGLILLSITTVCFSAILVWGDGIIIDFFDIGLVKPYLWLLIIGFFGGGIYNLLNYWTVRHKDYKRITLTKIHQSIGNSLSKIILGFFFVGPIGLIIGQMISQTAGVGNLASAIWRKEKFNLKLISLNGIVQVGKKFRSYPLFNFPASLVNTISLYIPPIMLLTIYDAHIAGFYSLAQSLVILPGKIISTSMGQAYLGEASMMIRERSTKLSILYRRTIKHLSIISIPLIGIPALLAPFLVSFIFGAEWKDAGWYCWPLVLMVVGSFVSGTTSLLSQYGYNFWQFCWDFTRLLFVLLGFYICYLLGFPPIISLTIYSFTLLLMYLVNIFMNVVAINKFTRVNCMNQDHW